MTMLCQLQADLLASTTPPALPADEWFEDLYSLLARFSQLNAAADIGSMNEGEVKGLYRFLQRLAQEGQ